MIPLIVKAGENAPLPKDGWFLKEDKARDMLRHMPPLAVMDRLGYHLSPSSWIAKTSMNFSWPCALPRTPEWLNDFDRLYLDLKPCRFRDPPHRI